MKSQISTAVAFALSLISGTFAIPVVDNSASFNGKPDITKTPAAVGDFLNARRTDCPGVSSVLIGEYCENLAPSSDETSCIGYVFQLDNHGTAFANSTFGSVINQGQNNETQFCADFNLVSGAKASEIDSCGTSWIYTFDDCVNGTSLYVIQEEDGGTKSATAAYETDITLPDYGDLVFYSKFVVDESAFA